MKFTNLLNSKLTFEKVLIDFFLKTQFLNEIMIYDKQKYVNIMCRIVKENFKI